MLERARRFAGDGLVTVRDHIRGLPTGALIAGGAVIAVLAIVLLVISFMLPDASATPPAVSVRVQATASPVQAMGIREQLALELRRARQASGLSLTGAGRRSGLAQSRLSGLEEGTVRPTARDVDALSGAYELSPEDHNRLMYLQFRLDR
ncbi:helix-turn-helix domain-containing protein [Sphaerisporangium album]|uniref:helix-turn-helix domain-containing protein n=1 Tax=Sphaerisporangium album TaxID=509200 RepID=UPI0015F04469|nr:helix-turn-helix transcriptional regulator [Sphaerisporangium album]